MIKYHFKIKFSEKHRHFVVHFKDMLAARRLTPLLLKLLPPHADGIFYNHNGGFHNYIAVSEAEGCHLWNKYIAKWLHADKELGNYFATNITGELIKPENCCYCGASNPTITETHVENGQAVERIKYCDSHASYYHDALMQAAFEG